MIAIVFSDSAYGNVKRDQIQRFDGRLVASELTNPDLVKMAESFGVAGYRANGPVELKAALRHAIRQSAPALIEVPVPDLPSPWGFIGLPKARG